MGIGGRATLTTLTAEGDLGMSRTEGEMTVREAGENRWQHPEKGAGPPGLRGAGSQRRAAREPIRQGARRPSRRVGDRLGSLQRAASHCALAPRG